MLYSFGTEKFAGVAQLVEQLICNQQVGGSSPSTSSRFSWDENRTRSLRGWAVLRKYHSVIFLTAKCEAAVPQARHTFRRKGCVRPPAPLTKLNMGEFPSGQRGQTVNLLLSASMVRIRPLPPIKRVLSTDNALFCYWNQRRIRNDLQTWRAKRVASLGEQSCGLYIITRSVYK